MILVTGGSGFLGHSLIRQLIEQGQKVRAIHRSQSDLSPLADLKSKIEWVPADLLETAALEEAFRGVTQVYHCAAIVSFSPQHYHQMMAINVEGTANIVNQCLDHQVEKLIHVSSIAALGRSTDGNVWVDEETEWQNSKLNSAYALSKMQAEMEVWRGAAEGLNMAIVNPSVIIGPWKWEEGTARFFKRVFNGLKFYTSGGTGFVDVEDVAKVMIELMHSEISSQRYLLNAINLPFKNFFDEIATRLKVPGPKYQAQPWMSQIAWRLDKLRTTFSKAEPLITKETARVAFKTFKYKTDKIDALMPQAFRPFGETLDRSCSTFLNEKSTKN